MDSLVKVRQQQPVVEFLQLLVDCLIETLGEVNGEGLEKNALLAPIVVGAEQPDGDDADAQRDARRDNQDADELRSDAEVHTLRKRSVVQSVPNSIRSEEHTSE